MIKNEKDSSPFIRDVGSDGRLYSPSTERNRDIVRDVFSSEMSANARVLEIGSGSGQHCVHILGNFPDMRWIGSDVSEDAKVSTLAWIKHEKLEDQFEGFHSIDASKTDWGVNGQVDGILCCNVIHISPWKVAQGLMAGASRYLTEGGKLFLYGPFRRDGVHVSESNIAFDGSLKSRNESWGVRDLEQDVVPVAEENGLRLLRVHDMPANNFAVIFEK